jgi:hypothetical protein
VNVTSFKKALSAGVAGTVIMTAFFYVSQYMHMPTMDFHGMIASHFGTGMAFTWLVYFGFGVVLAFAYGIFFRKLPSHSWSRGLIYALMLWGFMEVVLMPIFGMGFFSGSMMVAVAAFIGMGLYGATVGYIYEN